MISEGPIPFKPFNFPEGVSKYRSRLPHWRQPGVTYFVTFRLSDSIPATVFETWEEEKIAWLLDKGVSLTPPIKPEEIPVDYRFSFEKEFNRKLNEYLDGCHGSCSLRRKKCRRELISKMGSSTSVIGDYVIMPNHVHLLATPNVEQESLEKSVGKIKGGSSFQINKLLGKSGPLWQKDSFNRMVRNAKALDRYQEYIKDNPAKAKLKSSEYSYHQGNYVRSVGFSR